MKKIAILTLDKRIFESILSSSILGIAKQKLIWGLELIDIRDFTEDKHKKVDDYCFGGSPGMLMKPDVIDRAIKSVSFINDNDIEFIHMSPRGVVLNKDISWNYAKSNKSLVILCSRYEGVDQRVLQHWNFRDISIGDFILTNGDIAAIVFIDSVVRLVDGALGNSESIYGESLENNLLQCNQYTRPYDWNGMKVPDVLVSGDHGKILKWRRKNSEEVTSIRRKDLYIKK